MIDRDPTAWGFQPLDLPDRELVAGYLRRDPPETSELTFTNLFVWRGHYRPLRREFADCLLVVLQPPGSDPVGLPPVGPGDRAAALDELARILLEWSGRARIERVGRAWADAVVDPARYQILPDPDQSDYVYRVDDLIHLSGRKYHQKKNHLNQFLNSHDFECRRLDQDLVQSVLAMQESWCRMRECALDPSLSDEDRAVYEALTHFGRLDYQGLALLMNGRVEAFSLGEPLNPDTVVIHFEKANPDIRGLYAVINQRFLQDVWSGFTFVNREQDLGVEGLRRAKESYHPDHMVDKFVLTPK